MIILFLIFGVMFIMFSVLACLLMLWKRYYVLPLGIESSKFFNDPVIRRTVCGDEVVLHDSCGHSRLVVRVYNPNLLNNFLLGPPQEQHYILWERKGFSKCIRPIS